jgi:molybdate transport system substrate-binding protein
MTVFMRQLFILGLVLAASLTSLRAQDVTIFAAASLSNALQDVAKAYQEKTGTPLKFSFAASSALAKQIEAGAPAQIFISADERWMDYLADTKLIVPETRISPIGNRLVLIAPADSPVSPVTIDAELNIEAMTGQSGRIAAGDPQHVPAGTYARQALEKLNLWGKAEPRLARADNVRAALALVETGEAPLGIVYSTDAAASKRVKVVGTFPIESHTRITYPFAMIAGQDSAEARQVFKFVTSDEALAIFSRHGFALTAGS